ncbi:kelch-like protein 8 isoform X2 [Rana temporaria]|uniref:kelch-like protein 8 isoform X2 n=1 Tax=Rana temporaria TaxID=8407 RepID=UPI001AAC524D|nr:kelch-like protein 8 isoform X2 [Rana temporaria]
MLLMASESKLPGPTKPQPASGRRNLPQDKSLTSDGDGDGSFVFEADDAWKEFHSSLLHFYEVGELCDVTLKVGSKLIPCHKLVLACVIPYFRAMFLSDMAEAKQTVIEIRDFDGDAFEDLVKFAYSSRVTLTVDNVQPLLYAACILQVELVAKACCEYMKLHFHPSNCLAVRAFAESHNRVDLMDMADRFACDHFADVVECDDFVSMSPQHLYKLLSSDDLHIENEKQVYNAAIKWLRANPQHHEAWLNEILSQVRLPLLPIEFLMSVVAKEQIIRKDLKCRDLLDEARNYHLHLSSRAVPDFEFTNRTTPRKQTAVKMIKSKWKSIRDAYARQLRVQRQQCRSGSARANRRRAPAPDPALDRMLDIMSNMSDRMNNRSYGQNAAKCLGDIIDKVPPNLQTIMLACTIRYIATFIPPTEADQISEPPPPYGPYANQPTQHLSAPPIHLWTAPHITTHPPRPTPPPSAYHPPTTTHSHFPHVPTTPSTHTPLNPLLQTQPSAYPPPTTTLSPFPHLPTPPSTYTTLPPTTLSSYHPPPSTYPLTTTTNSSTYPHLQRQPTYYTPPTPTPAPPPSRWPTDDTPTSSWPQFAQAMNVAMSPHGEEDSSQTYHHM